MKSDTELMMKWIGCTKLTLNASRTQGTIAQSVRASVFYSRVTSVVSLETVSNTFVLDSLKIAFNT